MFKWYDLDEGKLNLTFSNRVTVQVGIYVKEDDKTSHIEEVYPMINIADQTNFSIALNMSNAFMLSTILSLYVEPDTIKEYFNKTNLSNGWYVSQKYVDKPVYNKVLTDKLALKLIPITDHRKIPMYKAKFIKNTNNTIEIDLTKAEMKSLATLLSMFSANASIYSFIFRQSNQYRYVENQLKTLESTNSILRSILDRLTLPQSNRVLPVTCNIESPDVDYTNIENEINNIDIEKKKHEVKKVSKGDELDIDSLEIENKQSESEEKFKQLVEETTGVKVSDKDSFDSISIDKLFPKEGEDVQVIEPVMNRSVIDVSTTKACLVQKEEKERIIYSLAKKHNIDRRTKNRSFVYIIAKKGLLDPKALPTLLNHRGMIGIPVTSVIYAASLFASAYKYLDTHEEVEIFDIATIVYKALQMSQVDSADMFANNAELKEYGQIFMDIFTKSLLPKDIGLTGIRTLDKYISLNHSEDNIFYNFSKLNVENDDNLKYLVKALTEVYFLLWYGENKYIKDVKLSNTSGYLMDVINVPMYEFARSYLINITSAIGGTYTPDMIKATLDFEEMVKYSTWDMETFKEAYIDLFSFYYKVINLIKTGDKIYEGMPCFS